MSFYYFKILKFKIYDYVIFKLYNFVNL